jgi:hypothetical protein
MTWNIDNKKDNGNSFNYLVYADSIRNFRCLVNFIVAIFCLIYDSTRDIHQQLEKQIQPES